MRRGRENETIADASYIVPPSSKPVFNYLHRMDFLKVLFEKEAVTVAEPVTKHEATGLKECEHFASEKGGRDVATLSLTHFKRRSRPILSRRRPSSSA